MSDNPTEFPRLPHGSPGPDPSKVKKGPSFWQALLYMPHFSFAVAAFIVAVVIAVGLGILAGTFWVTVILVILFLGIPGSLFLSVIGKEGDKANIKAKPPTETVTTEEKVVVVEKSAYPPPAKTTSGNGGGKTLFIVLLLIVLALIAYKRYWPSDYSDGAAPLRESEHFNPTAIADDADLHTENDHDKDPDCVHVRTFKVKFSLDDEGKFGGFVRAPHCWVRGHWTKSFVGYKAGQCVGFWHYGWQSAYPACAGPNNLPEFDAPPMSTSVGDPNPNPNPMWRMQPVCSPEGECPTIIYRRTD